ALVQYDIMTARAKVFDITDLVGPTAMAYGKDAVGIRADSACRQQAVGGQRLVWPRTGSVGDDQERQAQSALHPQQPAHHMAEISVSHHAEVEPVDGVDDRDAGSGPCDGSFDLLENKILHPPNVLRFFNAKIYLEPLESF